MTDITTAALWVALVGLAYVAGHGLHLAWDRWRWRRALRHKFRDDLARHRRQQDALRRAYERHDHSYDHDL